MVKKNLKKIMALAITCSMTMSMFCAAMPEKAAAVQRTDKTSEKAEDEPFEKQDEASKMEEDVFEKQENSKPQDNRAVGVCEYLADK